MNNLKLVFFSCFTICFSVINAQQLNVYNPQELYDEAGGLFDKDIVRNMFVDFEDPNYHTTLVNAFFENPSLRIPATVAIDEMTAFNVGARYKGNSTFCLPNDEGNVKVPYNLDFNYFDEDGELLGYHKVKLANAWMDPTFAKEYVAAQIYQRYLPTPEVNLVALHTQGNYTGIYANTESINKQFLKKHFDENDGALFKCDGSGVFCGDPNPYAGEPNLTWLGNDSASYYNSYVIKSDHGWAELMDFIYILNNNPNEIESVLNVDRVLWAFALNQAICNYDTYNGYYVHNYYMYLSENGLWQMIPWDLDNSFVGALLGWDYFNPNNLYHFDIYNGEDPEMNRPLLSVLLSNPLYRKQYNAHLRTIIDESLDVIAIENEAFEIQGLAEDQVAADLNKPFPQNLHTTNVTDPIFTGWGFGGITSTAESRKQFLNSSSCPELNYEAPVISSIGPLDWSSDETGTYITIQATVSNAYDVDLMATTSEYNSHFEAYEMNNIGGGVYETHLYFDLNSPVDWKFYIRAMNEDAMTLSPARAEYEFYYFTTPLGIEEAIVSSDFDLVPNPTSSLFSIRGISSADMITVRDTKGRVVHTKSGISPIEASFWGAGVYFVEVENGSNKTVKRLVVCE